MKKKKIEKNKRCTQTKCDFYINGGCKQCSVCSAKPYEINKDCKSCLDCMNKPDGLRFEVDDDNDDEESPEDKLKTLKVMKRLIDQEIENLESEGVGNEEEDDEKPNDKIPRYIG